MNIRLNIVVEGQTEESFVKQILAPYLGTQNIFCSARCIATSIDKRKNRIYRGGHIDYIHLKNDLGRWMKQDDHPDTYFSTMIDLYRLPNEFPDFEKAKSITDPFAKVNLLENAIKRDLNHPRFVPYIQLHEFEALLFCDATQFLKGYPHRAKETLALVKEASAFYSPDYINDGLNTAPSKRIIRHIPEYEKDKAVSGPLIAEYIGLENLKKCEHFSEWLAKLEHLAEK